MMDSPDDEEFDAVRHFGAEKAGAYDEYIPRVIPGYENLHQLSASIVKTQTGGRGRVLVVGAGTGEDSIYVCRDHPLLSVVGYDLSGDMLAVARRRVADEGLGDRIKLIEGEVGKLPQEAAFDAATMILVMHFIADDGSKTTLLKSIAARLKPGAALVLGDMFGKRDSPQFTDQETIWRNMQIAAGVEADVVDKSIRHAAKDTHPISENRLCELLDEAGFEDVTPFFRSLMFGGWVARKRGA